jgi:hypothetical protein
MMESHTLILTIPKAEIPSKDIFPFVKNIILSNIANIDYFGSEQDNQADYIDEKMQNTIDTTTYITFHFDYPEIDYDKFNEEETLQLIVDVIEQQKIGEVKIDDKDIDFFIYQY